MEFNLLLVSTKLAILLYPGVKLKWKIKNELRIGQFYLVPLCTAKCIKLFISYVHNIMLLIIQAKHCLHDFAHKQDSQLNSSVLITVWRVVIEVWQDSQLNSSAFSHCSVCGVLLLGKVYI